MKISVSALFSLYERTTDIAQKYPLMAADFSVLQKQFDDKRHHPDASIMVYGVYNSGKSTIINALTGQDLAKTGDIPLTDKIDAYSWNNSIILDTPGVDAPLKHENVTREQMLKADAVIFVVNPSGAAEEEKTFHVLLDILQAKKKLFLVLNDKNNMDDKDIIFLKNDIRSRLQIMAAERGMKDILQDIPILRINAKMAFKAKQDNLPGLLRMSYFEDFEEALVAFINDIDSEHIYQRLGGELNIFLDKMLKIIDSDTSSENVRHIDTLLKDIIQQQYDCRKNITAEITRQRDEVYRGCKAALRQNSVQARNDIESLLIQASSEVEKIQKQEMTYFTQRFEKNINNLHAVFYTMGKKNCALSLSRIPVMQQNNEPESPQENSGINAEMINHTVTTLGGIAKPEHIVNSLETIKAFLPSLMKGIGPRTMEKWGAMMVGKWIPYVGPAITIISSVWGIFAEDDETKKARAQSEQQRHAWERYQQELEDFSQMSASQFESNARTAVNDAMDPWFALLLDKVKTTRLTANQQEKIQSDNVIEVQEIKSQLCGLV